MTIKCKNCGHGKTHHYRYTSLTTGRILRGHCYYPGFKAKQYECTCSEFIDNDALEQKTEGERQ